MENITTKATLAVLALGLVALAWTSLGRISDLEDRQASLEAMVTGLQLRSAQPESRSSKPPRDGKATKGPKSGKRAKGGKHKPPGEAGGQGEKMVAVVTAFSVEHDLDEETTAALEQAVADLNRDQKALRGKAGGEIADPETKRRQRTERWLAFEDEVRELTPPDLGEALLEDFRAVRGQRGARPLRPGQAP